MKVRLLALLWLLPSVACTSVEIVPQDGGSAPTAGAPTDGGFDASGGAGAGSIGGAPVGGAPAPGPVPGCEALELAGEPILMGSEPPPIETHVSLVTLEGGRAGLVYLRGWADGAEMRSRTIDGAFESWPPVVSEPVTQYEGFIASHVWLGSHVPSGLFTLTSGVQGIYSFDSIGRVREPVSDGWQTFLHPGAETPFDVVSYPSTGFSYTLQSYDSLDAPAPSSSAVLPIVGCRTTRMATGAGGALFSMASDYYCDDDPRVDFFKNGPSGVELVGGFDLPIAPTEQSLAPRAGGYWYFTSSPYEGIGSRAYPLDESGVLVGEPWVDDWTYGDFSPQFLPWRDGFLGSHREDGEVSLFVSDGWNRTDSQPVPGIGMNVLSSNSALAMAIGGDDAGSILVAYPILQGVLLARFECVTPFK